MAVNYPIPPWIAQGADPAAQYAQGLGIGVRIGAERAAQQYQQQALLRSQAQDEFEKQYKTQVLNLQVDKAMRVQQAQAGFQQAVQSGMDPSQALMMFGPGMGDSAADIIRAQGLAEQRTANDEIARLRLASAGRTADLRERELGLRERNIERLDKRYQLSDADRQRIAPLQKQIDELHKQRLELDPEADRVKRRKLAVEANYIQRQIDQITNPVEQAVEAAPVEATVTPQPAAPSSTGERVKVISPDGKRGSIPVEQLDEALREGYRQVE